MVIPRRMTLFPYQWQYDYLPDLHYPILGWSHFLEHLNGCLGKLEEHILYF